MNLSGKPNGHGSHIRTSVVEAKMQSYLMASHVLNMAYWCVGRKASCSMPELKKSRQGLGFDCHYETEPGKSSSTKFVSNHTRQATDGYYSTRALLHYNSEDSAVKP